MGLFLISESLEVWDGKLGDNVRFGVIPCLVPDW